MRQAWLTQDTIPDRQTVAITLPDDEAWRAQFLGALLLLTGAENWELFGTLTPEQMAAEWLEIFTTFTQGTTSMLPIGTIVQFSGIIQPDDWFFCNGGDIGRDEYPELFEVIGTTYGPGDGSTTFNIPDLRKRVPVGLDEENPTYDNIGTLAGAENVTLITGQMPEHSHIQNSHNHTQNAHTHTQNAHGHTIFGFLVSLAAGATVIARLAGITGDANVSSANTTATNQNTTATNQATTATNQNTGGGEAHTNMQPYIILNYIIKYR